MKKDYDGPLYAPWSAVVAGKKQWKTTMQETEVKPKARIETSFGGTVASSNLSGVIPNSSFPSVLPAVSGANLTNLPAPDLSNLNASNLTSGTIPDARFPSVLPALDGSALTGIQGLAEPLSNTAPLNKFLKTPKTINIGAGTSLTIENSDAASGNVAFVKEGTIHVSVGGTFHVKNNTKLRLNVLGIF